MSKVTKTSKTTTKNIDDMIDVVIAKFNLNEKDVRLALVGYLSFTSKFKKSKKKDPDAPKKSLSSYMYFTIDKRPSVATKDLKFTEITKKLGSMWSKLSVEEKKPYVDMAKLDAERYHHEKKLFDELRPKVPKVSSKADNADFIINPKTKKFVKRTSTLGVKILKEMS